MKLRALMMLLTVLTAGGVGWVTSQKFMPGQPDLEPANSETWKHAIFGERDRAADRNHGLVVVERMALKDGIVRSLVEGNITLEQAARRFVDLNKDNKSYFVGVECTYPNLDFKEAFYRHVLTWAEGVYGKQTEYPFIRERLEAQFEDCRQKGFPLPPRPQAVSTVERMQTDRGSSLLALLPQTMAVLPLEVAGDSLHFSCPNLPNPIPLLQSPASQGGFLVAGHERRRWP